MIKLQAIKTNIKLNTKKLYQADGYAVHELLKIAMSLYEAQNKSAQDDIMSGDTRRTIITDTSGKLNELNNTQRLASQLTVCGASLFDLLGREVKLGQIRNSKVTRQFDTSSINIAFKDVIHNAEKDIVDTKQQIDNITVNSNFNYLIFIINFIVFSHSMYFIKNRKLNKISK